MEEMMDVDLIRQVEAHLTRETAREGGDLIKAYREAAGLASRYGDEESRELAGVAERALCMLLTRLRLHCPCCNGAARGAGPNDHHLGTPAIHASWAHPVCARTDSRVMAEAARQA